MRGRVFGLQGRMADDALVPERLGALCAHDPGGARSLRRRLQTLVEGPAAELLLRDPSVRALHVRWEQGTAVVEAGPA